MSKSHIPNPKKKYPLFLMNRRRFLISSACLTGALLIKKPSALAEDIVSPCELVKVSNGEPAQLVQTAVKALGGMSKFIKKGDKVVVKPNIGWDRNPMQGANTHPEVVAETVKLCLQAGAAEVQVFDNSCNTAQRCYDNSGIAQAAEKAGAKVSFVIDRFFKNVDLKEGVLLNRWKFYRPALEADKYINLPILKQHGMAVLTIGLKNIMGIIGGNRGSIHRDFDVKIVDLNLALKPALTIVDATRVLRRNGPVGGNPADVDHLRQVIAGIDPVAVDAAAAELFGIPHIQLGFIVEAEKRGLGSVEKLNQMLSIDLES